MDMKNIDTKKITDEAKKRFSDLPQNAKNAAQNAAGAAKKAAGEAKKNTGKAKIGVNKKLLKRDIKLNLDNKTKVLLGAAVAVDLIGRGLALYDLKKRPAHALRGNKKAWGAGLGLVDSAGILPIAYFLLGRKNNPFSK